MKVHDSSLNSVSIGTNSAGRTEGVKGGDSRTSQSKGSSGQDRISLSDLSSVVSSASGDTPARVARISQLTAAYKSGAYHPDSASTAKGIIQDAFQAG